MLTGLFRHMVRHPFQAACGLVRSLQQRHVENVGHRRDPAGQRNRGLIRKFLSTSDNAVRTQIYIALIVFLLLHLAHEAQKVSIDLLQFVRLARTHLTSRRDIRALDQPGDPPPRPDPRQYGLDWSQV
jgi:hypothetical protein